LSRGVGAAVSDKKLIDYAVDELTKITGKAISTISKKDVASFKLRKGMPIVRRLLYVEKECMSFDIIHRYHVLEISVVSKLLAFDGRGNYNLGVIEQIIFQKLTSIK
jgi:large subunit ribosomal protein L5